MSEWQTVPVELTDEMNEAAMVAAMDPHTGYYDFPQAWSAALSVAPQPTDELARLEREIATEAAGIGLLKYAHKGVVDLSDVSDENTRRDAKYLALRGLIRIKEA